MRVCEAITIRSGGEHRCRNPEYKAGSGACYIDSHVRQVVRARADAAERAARPAPPVVGAETAVAGHDDSTIELSSPDVDVSAQLDQLPAAPADPVAGSDAGTAAASTAPALSESFERLAARLALGGDGDELTEPHAIESAARQRAESDDVGAEMAATVRDVAAGRGRFTPARVRVWLALGLNPVYASAGKAELSEQELDALSEPAAEILTDLFGVWVIESPYVALFVALAEINVVRFWPELLAFAVSIVRPRAAPGLASTPASSSSNGAAGPAPSGPATAAPGDRMAGDGFLFGV